VSEQTIEQLRAAARVDDWPAEVRLLIATLSAEEWDRLGELIRDWPAGRGPRVRLCLEVLR
jgi:hypothetical protein